MRYVVVYSRPKVLCSVCRRCFRPDDEIIPTPYILRHSYHVINVKGGIIRGRAICNIGLPLEAFLRLEFEALPIELQRSLFTSAMEGV